VWLLRNTLTRLTVHPIRHDIRGGRSLVSKMRLRISRYLTIPFAPANLRFFTHFGEKYCRMSSIHFVVEAPDRRRNLILTTLSTVLFDLPAEQGERLEKLWVDNLYSSA
jgi:hypothetical protein